VPALPPADARQGRDRIDSAAATATNGSTLANDAAGAPKRAAGFIPAVRGNASHERRHLALDAS
jgi:hypothetical protein